MHIKSNWGLNERWAEWWNYFTWQFWFKNDNRAISLSRLNIGMKKTNVHPYAVNLLMKLLLARDLSIQWLFMYIDVLLPPSDQHSAYIHASQPRPRLLLPLWLWIWRFRKWLWVWRNGMCHKTCLWLTHRLLFCLWLTANSLPLSLVWFSAWRAWSFQYNNCTFALIYIAFERCQPCANPSILSEIELLGFTCPSGETSNVVAP